MTILLKSQLRATQDRAHDVIEVVSDAARQLANGLEPLRLAQLPLHRAQLGDILRNQFKPSSLACGGGLPHVQPHGYKATVSASPFHFCAVDLAAFPA